MVEEQNLGKDKASELVKAVRELHAIVKQREAGYKKQLIDYIKTGVGDKGHFLAYYDVRKMIEERFSEYLEGEE